MRPLRTLALAAGLWLALPAAQAAYLPSAEVNAVVDGNLLNQLGGDTQTGDARSEVTASAALSLPPITGATRSASFSGLARAGVGSLGVSSRLDVRDAISRASFLGPDAGVRTTAGFRDEWTFTDRPLDTRGTLRLTTHFEGSASATGSNANARVFGRYRLDLSSLGAFDNPVDLAGYTSADLLFADETVTLELDFLYGRPVLVFGDLISLLELFPLGFNQFFSGGGVTDFGHTASLTALEVRAEGGVFGDDYALETLSGGVYPFQAGVPSPVPEPSSAVLLAAGLALLWRMRRR